jgi:hypothetical protein
MSIASKIVLIAAAPFLLVIGVALSTPAAAIKAEGAMAACKKRPPGICRIHPSTDGTVMINVCNPGDPCREIWCPTVGACQLLNFTKGKAAAIAARNATRVLSGF